MQSLEHLGPNYKQDVETAFQNLVVAVHMELNENSTPRRVTFNPDVLNPEDVLMLYKHYLESGRGSCALSLEIDLTQVISDKKLVEALAERCGMTDLRKYHHQRLIVTGGDAEYWAKLGLRGYELAAHFVARRLLIEVAYTIEGEISTQGDLSYLVGDRKKSEGEGPTLLDCLLEVARQYSNVKGR